VQPINLNHGAKTVRIVAHISIAYFSGVFMRTQAEIGASDQLETVQQEGRSEDQASHARNQKISLVVSDGSYMTSELLARALTRIKALTILKCTVTFVETLDAIVDLRPDVAVISLHFADGPYKALELLRPSRPGREESLRVADGRH
jgi:hypothetical protein